MTKVKIGRLTDEGVVFKEKYLKLSQEYSMEPWDEITNSNES